MSVRISTFDEDPEDLQAIRGSRNASSLSSYNLPRSTSQQSKNKTHHCVYLSIIVVLLAIIALFFYSEPRMKITESDVDQKLKDLSEEVSRLKGAESANVVVINSLKKDIEKLQKTTKNQGSTPQPVAPVAPAQTQNQPKPQDNINKPPPKETKNTNKPKHSYMTPELEKVSEYRRQKEGMGKVAQGTPSLLQYLIKNQQGQTIDEVLYDATTRDARRKFQEQRIAFTAGKKNFQSLYLVSFNNKIDASRDEEERRVEAEEYERIDRIWQFSKYTEELPMCVVMPGYNNNAKFRIEYNLNSVFQQNYTNYFVVVINDASTDNSDEVYRKYFDFYGIDKSRYAYIENTERKTALENIYIATHDYCSPDSIVLNMDADDEFIGKNVLKTFNAGYQKHKSGVLYSNFYWYDQGGNIMLGFTSEYTENDKKNRNYRQAPQRFSHLRSYRTQLFLKIAEKDFQDAQGKFWTSAYDMVMYFPLMELSCGRINKIEGFHYLYNINTGLNDYAVDRSKQARIDQTVRRGTKYDCSEEFNEKMNALP